MATIGVVALAAALLVGGTKAKGDHDDKPRKAKHGQRQIELDDDWDGAGACAVLTEEDIRCFDDFTQMEQATGGKGDPRDNEGNGPSTPVWAASEDFTLAADCDNDASRWMYLWEHNDFTGRALKFNDVDYWQNLTSYGFNDAASSYWNTTRCTVYLAEHTNGGGAWLWAPSQTSASAMPGGWNDRISSLYVARN